MMTDKAVSDFIEAQNDGEVDSCYGPSYIDTTEIWEVWVLRDGIWYTRFVYSDEDEEPHYIGQFQQFCAFVHGRESILRGKALEYRFRLISLLAATVTFVGSVSALICFMYLRYEANLSFLALLGGIIASGATMFFGNWKMPNLPSKTQVVRIGAEE